MFHGCINRQLRLIEKLLPERIALDVQNAILAKEPTEVIFTRIKEMGDSRFVLDGYLCLDVKWTAVAM